MPLGGYRLESSQSEFQGPRSYWNLIGVLSLSIPFSLVFQRHLPSLFNLDGARRSSGWSGVLNPSLYARYIIEVAPTEFFIVNLRRPRSRREEEARRRKGSRARSGEIFDLVILRRTINHLTTAAATHNRRYHGITSLRRRNRPSRLEVQLNQLRTLPTRCMRMKAAITKQPCVQCHVGTRCSLRNRVASRSTGGVRA